MRSLLLLTTSWRGVGGWATRKSARGGPLAVQRWPEKRRMSNSVRLEGEDESSNLTEKIRALTKERLLHVPSHPLHTIKERIFSFFNSKHTPVLLPESSQYHLEDSLSPTVTTTENFDELLTPYDHPSRQRDESYYLSADALLRCHMTAHQRSLLLAGHKAALFAGDVYRRDTIDATHYPVFHQMDAFRVFTNGELEAESTRTGRTVEELLKHDLQDSLEQLAKHIFGLNCHTRWVDATFPFTHPSWELEVHFDPNDLHAGKETVQRARPREEDENWLEVLGSGVIHSNIMDKARPDCKGWAFGLGLERWAMVLYGIPDIRLFWTKDQRFLGQFKEGEITRFKPYSKYPPCNKDVAFWISPDFTPNNFYEVVRSEAGDLVESVVQIDRFTHPKTGRTSACYRLNFRSMDRSLTNEEVNVFQEKIRERVVKDLGVELR